MTLTFKLGAKQEELVFQISSSNVVYFKIYSPDMQMHTRLTALPKVVSNVKSINILWSITTSPSIRILNGQQRQRR